jgi:L-alanine-DL-glutamate epimerase-like enolase superfamily enzyme
MKITSVEAIPLAASFKEVFRFGTTDRSTSPNVVVRIATEDGAVGYGEACPVPAFTSETQASVVELVETRVAPTLVGRDASQRVPRLADLARVLRFAPFTVAAVDTALLDLLGRHAGVPVSNLLGGAFRDRVEVHGSVTWDEDPARVAESALEQRETYRWLKLYAGRGAIDADLDRLQAVRDSVGPDARLMVDINGMWGPSDAIRALDRVRAIGLELLEQPLPPGAEPFQRDLVARLSLDVAADESVRSAADAARVVRERTATVVNVGMSKLGEPHSGPAGRAIRRRGRRRRDGRQRDRDGHRHCHGPAPRSRAPAPRLPVLSDGPAEVPRADHGRADHRRRRARRSPQRPRPRHRSRRGRAAPPRRPQSPLVRATDPVPAMVLAEMSLDGDVCACQSRRVKSCGPSGSQDLAF